MAQTVAAASLSVVTQAQTRTVTAVGHVGESKVSCPAGYYVTGGGYRIWGGNVGIKESKPIGAQGWMVDGFVYNGEGNGDFQAFAVCVKLVP